MPFCPHCKAEYIEGIRECRDCGVPLVDELPEEKPIDIEWVLLHELPNVVYGEMVKEALEKGGIPCLMKPDFLAGAYGIKGTSSVGSHCKLYVPKERFEEAEDILNQMVDPI